MTPRLAYLRCANPEQPIELVVVTEEWCGVIELSERQVLALVAGGASFLAERRAEAVREGEISGTVNTGGG